MFRFLSHCREKDTDIAFAQDAIDEYKVLPQSIPYLFKNIFLLLARRISHILPVCLIFLKDNNF